MNTERTQRRLFTHTGTGTRTRTVLAGTTALRASVRRRVRFKRWGRRAWQKLSRRVRAVTKAITPLGWFVLLIAVIGLAAGVAFSWIEAWFVAVCAVFILAVAIPFLIGTRSYDTSLVVRRKHVVVGGDAHLTIEVENVAARPMLPAVIELPVGQALRELTVPLLGPGQRVELQVSVPAERRGVITAGPLTVAHQDPLGLLRRERTWRELRHIHVHPRTVQLPPNSAGLVRDLEGQASKRLIDSDLSFHAVREYAPGDAQRHIHWKSTAKTGTLMVRQYEESQTARNAVLFDARLEEYASDDEFELGVSIAASIATQAVREGRERFVASAWTPGRFRPRSDGLEELPSRNPQEMLDSWAELGVAQEGLPIEQLSRSLAHTVRDLSIVVLVTGSRPEVKRLRRAALSFAGDVHVLAVRAELLADPRAHRFDALTVATVGALVDLPHLMVRGAL